LFLTICGLLFFCFPLVLFGIRVCCADVNSVAGSGGVASCEFWPHPFNLRLLLPACLSVSVFFASSLFKLVDVVQQGFCVAVDLVFVRAASISECLGLSFSQAGLVFRDELSGLLTR